MTDYKNCWFSSTNDLPYKDYWGRKAGDAAKAFNECSGCAYNRVNGLNIAEQRFEFQRLGRLGWIEYTGDDFYVK